MCVIMIADDEHRPTEAMVEAAWKHNSHGGGVAWVEKNAEGVNEVVWKKGLSWSQMKEYCATLPFPFVAHFRKESVGGQCDELTHPFPITTTTGNELEGRGAYHVLFQNGTWKDWWGHVTQAAFHVDNPKLPMGNAWSDTRGMAWLCSIAGIGFMDLICQKGVAFGPDDYHVFAGKDGWEIINEVWCSNAAFWKSKTQTQPIQSATQWNQQTGHGAVVDMSKMCRDRNCAKTQGIDNGYCEEHKSQRPVQRALPPAEGLFCHQCKRLIRVDTDHVADCRKRMVSLVCDTCKISLGLGFAHLEGCPEAGALLTTAEAEQARSQFKDPFFLLTVAEKIHQADKVKLGKNELKRVWKRITGGDRNLSLLVPYQNGQERKPLTN